ncbi:PqqD family protein [bacterium]|nr:MAG: PqqD family protein [bacterium]
MLDKSTRLMPNSAEVAAETLDGEVVLINLANGIYYSLDGTGSFVWGYVERKASSEDIAKAMVASYDVSPQIADEDVRRLMDELVQEGLALVAGDKGDFISTKPEAVAQRATYSTPLLNVYSDMQGLLALDPPLPDLIDRA